MLPKPYFDWDYDVYRTDRLQFSQTIRQQEPEVTLDVVTGKSGDA